jgi:hypothetical protein
MNKIFIAIFLATASVAHAQDASYEDTVEYIIERTNFVGRFDGETSRSWVAFPQRCLLHVENSVAIQNGQIRHHFRASIPLRELDPTEVSTNEAYRWVAVSVREKRNLVIQEFLVSDQGSHTIERDNRVSIKTTSNDVTPRVARAFAHLIELCGGEKELF